MLRRDDSAPYGYALQESQASFVFDADADAAADTADERLFNITFQVTEAFGLPPSAADSTRGAQYRFSWTIGDEFNGESGLEYANQHGCVFPPAQAYATQRHPRRTWNVRCGRPQVMGPLPDLVVTVHGEEDPARPVGHATFNLNEQLPRAVGQAADFAFRRVPLEGCRDDLAKTPSVTLRVHAVRCGHQYKQGSSMFFDTVGEETSPPPPPAPHQLRVTIRVPEVAGLPVNKYRIGTYRARVKWSMANAFSGQTLIIDTARDKTIASLDPWTGKVKRSKHAQPLPPLVVAVETFNDNKDPLTIGAVDLDVNPLIPPNVGQAVTHRFEHIQLEGERTFRHFDAVRVTMEVTVERLPAKVFGFKLANPFAGYEFDWERYAPVLLVAGAALLFIALLLLIVLIATSFTPVDRQHLGIRYNPHTGRIDDSEVFANGHHFWSPAARALQYPSTWRRVQLSRQELEVAVTSGQVLRLACEFRYSFKKSTLIPIVRTFSTLEEKAVRAAAIGALKNAAPGFTFEQYVTDRDAVTDGLHAAVGAGLLAAGIDVTLPRPGFILGFVELPATVLALNQAVFFQAEAQIRNEFEKQAAVVRLATQTNETRINATAEAVRAGAEATRTQLRAVAAHRGTAQLRSETGRLVKALAERLGVATAAGHGALAEYSLLLAAVEGTVSTISPNTSGAAENPRTVTVLDAATGRTPGTLGITPMIG